MKLKVKMAPNLLREQVSVGLGSVVPAAGHSDPTTCLQRGSGKPAECLEVKGHNEVQTDNIIKIKSHTQYVRMCHWLIGYVESPQCGTPDRGTRR